MRTSDVYLRPTDIQVSCGNPEKARRLLGWKATLHMPQVVNDSSSLSASGGSALLAASPPPGLAGLNGL